MPTGKRKLFNLQQPLFPAYILISQIHLCFYSHANLTGLPKQLKATLWSDLCAGTRSSFGELKKLSCVPSKKSLARVQELFTVGWRCGRLSQWFFWLVCVIVCLLLTAVCEASPEHTSPNSTAVWTMSPACFITPAVEWSVCFLALQVKSLIKLRSWSFWCLEIFLLTLWFVWLPKWWFLNV